jgi:hypothetical protein
MWFVQESRVSQPLVTNGIIDNNLPGTLGQTGTQVLLGNQSFNEGPYHGLRVRVGNGSHR